MNRIDKKISALRVKATKILSPYLTAGDPSIDSTLPLMHALVNAGADILELGIPFSDPMAEGPVIQAAMERALANGVHTKIVLDLVTKFRKKDKETPIILMGYLNSIESYGYETFAKDAKEAGVDGTILVDLPPEESSEIIKIWSKYDLYSIYLCSPTTSSKRMENIAKLAKGYLYYVSLKGVTGAELNLSTLAKEYEQRKSETRFPLFVGFGIKTKELAAEISKFADGIIVGAALINQIQLAHKANQDIFEAGAKLIRDMRKAMNNEYN